MELGSAIRYDHRYDSLEISRALCPRFCVFVSWNIFLVPFEKLYKARDVRGLTNSPAFSAFIKSFLRTFMSEKVIAALFLIAQLPLLLAGLHCFASDLWEASTAECCLLVWLTLAKKKIARLDDNEEKQLWKTKQFSHLAIAQTSFYLSCLLMWMQIARFAASDWIVFRRLALAHTIDFCITSNELVYIINYQSRRRV